MKFGYYAVEAPFGVPKGARVKLGPDQLRRRQDFVRSVDGGDTYEATAPLTFKVGEAVAIAEHVAPPKAMANRARPITASEWRARQARPWGGAPPVAVPHAATAARVADDGDGAAGE